MKLPVKLTGRRWVDHRGYVRLAAEPPLGWIYEHRYVMQQKLGRRILPTEAVHHKNHDRQDNRPENLELMSAGEHIAHHNTEAPKRKRAIPRKTPAPLPTTETEHEG